MSTTRVAVTHPQFADDTIVMCKDSIRQLKFLRCIIHCFEAILSLQINLAKSCIYSVGQVPDVWRNAEVLGCKLGSFPTTNLGMPLGAPFKCKSMWNPMVEKIHKRLAGWKGMFLSEGKRLTLIKSILASLPTYFMSLLVILASVAVEIKKCQRRFPWQKRKEKLGIN